MTARMRSVGSALAFDRGLHGLRISVHGEKGRAELRDALDALGDRIADVVQLEIEKDLLARRDQFRAQATSPPAKAS